MVAKGSAEHRSGCPVSLSLEIFGDRWSLLIVRDLMVRGHRRFRQFQEAGEGIATNILAQRLGRLEVAGIITSGPSEEDGRSIDYRLAEKGIDLARVMFELLMWGARHEGGAGEAVGMVEKNREAIIAETRRRWKEKDSRPLIPTFSGEVIRELASMEGNDDKRRKKG